MVDRDIKKFVRRLKDADPSEIGFVVATVAHCRNFLRKDYGWDMDFPAEVLTGSPNATKTLSLFIDELQARKSDDMALLAAGMTVWWHTLRAFEDEARLRITKDMWNELQRGMPFAHDRGIVLGTLYGHQLNTIGADRVPRSLGI